MKVCLLNPPHHIKGLIRTGRWVRKSYAKQSWYPIWLGYATALLEREGHECLFLDAPVSGYNHSEAMRRIRAFKPDLIACYWSYDTKDNDIAYADRLMKIAEVVLVGPWSHVAPDILEEANHVRYVTNGEFEHTLLELAEDAGSETQGLTWKRDGEVTRNPPRPLVSREELDRIPFVTDVYRRHLNIRSYRQTAFRHPFVDMLTARGCPHHCTFCVWPRALQGGPSYRKRSTGNVIEELRFIEEKLPYVNQVHFQNDTLPESYAIELSNAILDAKLNLTWSAYCRAELSYEALKTMREAGCRSLHVGYETGNQEMLQVIEKGITLERMQRFAADINRLGLWTCAGFIIGLPGETEESIRDTIEFAKRIRPRRFSLAILKRYPNIPAYCQPRSNVPHDVLKEREKWAFTQFYLLNPSWMFQQAMSPREWKNVTIDGFHLLRNLVMG